MLDPAGQQLDQIQLLGIAATGYHGVFAHERRDGQPFVADVVVHLDTRRAAAGDDLAYTLDYGVLAEQVSQVLAGDPAALVETVAERIAATVLAHPQPRAVDVAVHKPHAPISVPFDDVVVRIHRDRTKLPAAEPLQARHAAPAPEPVPRPAPLDPMEESLPPVPPPPPATAVIPTTPAGPTDSGEIVEAELVSDALDVAPQSPVEVVLALGANLGAAQDTLRDAVAELAVTPGIEVADVSALARTAAVGGPDQPDYLNAVVIARTTLSARDLLRATAAVEQAHGRERTVVWGPRTLDIDIIVYGTTTAVTDDLELPHPRAHQRAFVLQPWSQVRPDAVLPGLGGGPVAMLAATAPDRDGVRWLALDWLTTPVPAAQPEPAVELEPELEPDAALADASYPEDRPGAWGP